jgi:hypothetical protein
MLPFLEWLCVAQKYLFLAMISYGQCLKMAIPYKSSADPFFYVAIQKQALVRFSFGTYSVLIRYYTE